MANSRAAAAHQLASIVRGARLDELTALAESEDGELANADARDKAFARLLVRTALRRRGQIEEVLSVLLDRPLPPRRGFERALLHTGAAQLLFLGTPAHAAVAETVNAAGPSPLRGLINAVLRRVANEGDAIAAACNAPRTNTPDWLWDQCEAAFGLRTAHEIALAHLAEPPLDLTPRRNAVSWSQRLGAKLLPTGSLRLHSAGRISALPGYGEGAWWVQDAAAALPAKLLLSALIKPADTCRIADLCAAPGGKTAQLAAAGAEVIAVDRDPERLTRLKQNLTRLSLSANAIAAHANRWMPNAPLDAVLLDAPCTATGTIRRHPDLPWLKNATSATKLLPLQDELLAHAAKMLIRGGLLIYCVCSLDKREGEERIAVFLESNPGFTRVPITPGEIGGLKPMITPSGDVRTLPCHLTQQGGMDGFYIVRLRRVA